LFGLLGSKSKQKYFTGGKSKKNFYREKPKMTYITGGSRPINPNFIRYVENISHLTILKLTYDMPM